MIEYHQHHPYRLSVLSGSSVLLACVFLTGIAHADQLMAQVSASNPTTVTVQAKTTDGAATPDVKSVGQRWLERAPAVANALAAARGRSEEATLEQGLAELKALAGEGVSKDAIADLAVSLLELFPVVDAPRVGSGAPVATALQASHRASRVAQVAKQIVSETRNPLAMAIYGHALAIGLGMAQDREAGIELIKKADEAAEPYAPMALVLTEAEGVPDALERAAATGDLRARYDLVRKQMANPSTRAKALEEAKALAPKVSRGQHRQLMESARQVAKDLDVAVELVRSLAERGPNQTATLVELGADDVATSSLGDLMPELPAMDWIQGVKFRLADKVGRQVVVIEFWATWCGPCVASIPKIEALQKKHGDQVTILAITDEDPAHVAQFVEKRKDRMTYAVATDAQGQLQRVIFPGFGLSGIPTALVIGKDGRIAWIGHPQSGLETEIEKALVRDKTPQNDDMLLRWATNRHLRLASNEGREAMALSALDPLRTTTNPLVASLVLTVVQAHMSNRVAKPNPELVLDLVNTVLATNAEQFYVLRIARGDLLMKLGRGAEAVEAYTDALRVLAREHPEIEAIRDKIQTAEQSKLRVAEKASAPVPDGSRVRSDSTVRRPRVAAPRGTPLKVAPRGTPLQLAPRGTPIRVAPRGTPLGLGPKASDTATTIAVESVN